MKELLFLLDSGELENLRQRMIREIILSEARGREKFFGINHSERLFIEELRVIGTTVKAVVSYGEEREEIEISLLPDEGGDL